MFKTKRANKNASLFTIVSITLSKGNIEDQACQFINDTALLS